MHSVWFLPSLCLQQGRHMQIRTSGKVPIHQHNTQTHTAETRTVKQSIRAADVFHTTGLNRLTEGLTGPPLPLIG